MPRLIDRGRPMHSQSFGDEGNPDETNKQSEWLHSAVYKFSVQH